MCESLIEDKRRGLEGSEDVGEDERKVFVGVGVDVDKMWAWWRPEATIAYVED